MPYIVRRFRLMGADFIVNLTNDGWFSDSYELDQHMAVSVFGAVQNRLGLVRAANTGISALIEPSGQITRVLEDETGNFRRVEGFLNGNVQVDGRSTAYTRYGEVFAYMCLGGTLGVLVWGAARNTIGIVGKK